ncbi:MAG: thiamine phosphate synthase [Blastocatellia bacterium]|jgi:thiamine-phosphate diphosphorylase
MWFPSLYALTDASATRSHVDQVGELVGAGVTIIQIRDKQASGRELFEMAVASLEFTRPAGAKLIVNDRVDVALAAGADGVHVGQDDLPANAAREILGPAAIVGVSTHSLLQATAAAELPVDYVAFGPIFATSTKVNPDPVVGIEGLAAARSIVALPLVAIGGITIENAAAVYASGADSVAVVSDLRKGASVDARVRAYLALSPSRGPLP